MILGKCLWLLWPLAATAQKVLVPKPNGTYNVDVRTSELIDYSRSSAQDPSHGPRKLMVSLFSPIHSDTRGCESRYMPDSTAAYYTEKIKQYNVSADFSRYYLQACSTDVSHGLPLPHPHARRASDNLPSTYPLLFLSGGLGNCRLLYSSMAQFVSSHGFLVLTLDHPYTSDFIQYADGSTIAYNASLEETPENLTPLFAPVVADAKFALDALTHNHTLFTLLFSAGALPTSLAKIGFLGHSFGGAAAAQAVHDDPRFAGGINLDGQLFGSAVQDGVRAPFVLWQSGRGESRQNPNGDWESFWTASTTAFKRNLELLGSSHGTFSDYIVLAGAYPWDYVKAGFGPINGLHAYEIVAAYVADFFGFVLLGKQAGLMQGPSKAYPEVEFIP